MQTDIDHINDRRERIQEALDQIVDANVSLEAKKLTIDMVRIQQNDIFIALLLDIRESLLEMSTTQS